MALHGRTCSVTSPDLTATKTSERGQTVILAFHGRPQMTTESPSRPQNVSSGLRLCQSPSGIPHEVTLPEEVDQAVRKGPLARFPTDVMGQVALFSSQAKRAPTACLR